MYVCVCVLIWAAIKFLTDLHSHSSYVHHFPCRDHTWHTQTLKKTPHTHPLNTQHHPVVPKSAGVFPHGASKRQRLRDQRLLWLCASARLLSALMQMCARQSGSERQAGMHACSVWVTIDPPTIHICVKLHSRSSSLYGYQLFCLFLTFSILHHSPPLCMQHCLPCVFLSLLNSRNAEIH